MRPPRGLRRPASTSLRLTGACLGLVPGGISPGRSTRLAASRNAAIGACERSCTRPLPHREGNLVNAGQQIGIASNVLIVPTDVVQHGENGLYVFIINDQK